MTLPRSLKRYLLMGGCGFLVDGVVLTGLMAISATAPTARLGSLLCAMTVTWALNRRFSFNTRTEKSVAEYIRYAVVSGAGAACNYAAYYVLLTCLPPLFALCGGTLSAMAWNYCGYRFWVFAPGQSTLDKSAA